MSSKDVHIYSSAGVLVTDLSGPGYSGGSGQWNFFGCMPQSVNCEFAITSNAAMTTGRDIVIVSPGDLYVDDEGSDSNPGTEAEPFATVQHAVDVAAPGCTIHVAAGTYDGTVNIVNRQNLTLVGQDKSTTIIKSSSTIGWGLSYGTTRNTVVRVETSTGIALQNFTIDLDLVKGNNVSAYFGWDSTGTLDNNIFKNSSLPDLPAPGYYYELCVYLRAPGYTWQPRNVFGHRQHILQCGPSCSCDT